MENYRFSNARYALILEMLKVMSSRYPRAFPCIGESKVLPLKVGIHKDIYEDMVSSGIEISRQIIKDSISLWVSRSFYHAAILSIDDRYDLAGAAAGKVSECDREIARKKIQIAEGRIERRKQLNKRVYRNLKHDLSGNLAGICPESCKKPESILAVMTGHADALLREGFNQRKFYSLGKRMQSGLVVANRQWLDFLDAKYRPNYASTVDFGDDSILQLLPYVRIVQASKMLPYRRTSGVGEARLAGAVSGAFGGHIDAADVVYKNSVLMLKDSITLNIARELDEELKIHKLGNDLQVVPACDAGVLVFKGFIRDTSDEVGRLHLGLAFDFILNADCTATAGEDELAAMDWATPDEIKAMPGVTIESWTKIMLDIPLAQASDDKGEWVIPSLDSEVKPGEVAIAVSEDELKLLGSYRLLQQI